MYKQSEFKMNILYQLLQKKWLFIDSLNDGCCWVAIFKINNRLVGVFMDKWEKMEKYLFNFDSPFKRLRWYLGWSIAMRDILRWINETDIFIDMILISNNYLLDIIKIVGWATSLRRTLKANPLKWLLLTIVVLWLVLLSFTLLALKIYKRLEKFSKS